MERPAAPAATRRLGIATTGPGLARTRPRGWLRDRRPAEARVLSRDAEEVFFASAGRISEGEVQGDAYYGSTMITVSLDRLATRWRGPLDEGAIAALCAAIDGSVRARLRAMRLACADVAHRFPNATLGTARVETRVVRAGRELHLDVDVEVPISGVLAAHAD